MSTPESIPEDRQESIPEDRQESYPCKCGGSIKIRGDFWECDSCDVSFFKVVVELI